MDSQKRVGVGCWKGEHRHGDTSKVKGEGEGEVLPAQLVFPACWADRGQGGQQRETGRK